MKNWAGVSIAIGLLTLVATFVGWPIAVIGVILCVAYVSKR